MGTAISLFLATALGSLALANSRAVAQATDRPAEVKWRNDCRLAAQVLRTGEPAPKREWAAEFISNCPEDGPPVLAAMWEAATLDSTKADHLFEASTRLRDQRLADAATAVVSDTRRGEAARIYAIRLLAQYIEPDATLPADRLVPPEGWMSGQRVRRLLLARSPHPTPGFPGDVPLRSDLASTTVSVLRAVAQSDANRRISYVATVVADALESKPAGTD